MTRKVRLTRRASIKLNDIHNYLNHNFGNRIAERFLKRTYSLFDILIEFPQIGTLEDKQRGIYGFVIEKPVTIFYRDDDQEIVMLNFFDNRKNPKKKL